MKDPKTTVKSRREKHMQIAAWLVDNGTMPIATGILTVGYTIQEGLGWMTSVVDRNYVKAKEALA